MNNLKLISIDFGQLQSVATPNFSAGTKLGFVVSQVMTLVFPIAGITLFFYLIYGGYQYIVSSSDPKAMQSAKQTITYAIIGFLVIFSAYFAVRAFGLALNLSAINSMFQ